MAFDSESSDSDLGSQHDETDDSSDSDSDQSHGLLDIEAQESDGASLSGSDDDDEDFGHYLQTFHQFKRLPPELRQLVWEMFCPDLVAKSRVFMVILPFEDQTYVSEGPFLSQQTEAARAVLATHRESRAWALRKLPDEFSVESGNCVVRFNKTVDVVYISGNISAFTNRRQSARTQEFLQSIENVALDGVAFGLGSFEAEKAHEVLDRFPNLKSAYLRFDDHMLEAENSHWCTSDKVHNYYLSTEEEEPGLGEDYEAIFAWPDLVRNRQFAEQNIPIDPTKRGYLRRLAQVPRGLGALADMMDDTQADGDEDDDAGEAEDDMPPSRNLPSGVEIWPMVQFEFERGVDRFERMRSWGGALEDWNSDLDGNADATSDSDASSEANEYESDGIDDEEIEEHDSSDDDDGLRVQPLSDIESPSTDASDHSIEDVDLTLDSNGLAQATFSSPEPESDQSEGEDEDDEGLSSTKARHRVNQSRRRVLDSDEDEAQDETANEQVNKAPQRNRKVRVVLSDSEGEDGDELEAELVPTKQSDTHKRRSRKIVDDDESSDSKEDSQVETGDASDESANGDEEEAPRKRMSLAERLNVHRQQNPIPSDSDSNDDSEGGVNFRNGDFDDDEDSDESEGGGEDDLGMQAEESDDEEDDG